MTLVYFQVSFIELKIGVAFIFSENELCESLATSFVSIREIKAYNRSPPLAGEERRIPLVFQFLLAFLGAGHVPLRILIAGRFFSAPTTI